MATHSAAEGGKAPRLYLITPPVAHFDTFAPVLTEAIDAAGLACLLLTCTARDEGAAKKIIRAASALVQPRDVALLVDGQSSLAVRAGADGVHLAFDETLLSEAVRALKPDRIVGAGGLRSRDDAMIAGDMDIDYVLFGEPDEKGQTPPLDATLERTQWWAEIFNVPCVAYAGTLGAIEALIAAGADFVAVGDAIWSDARGVTAALRDAEAAVTQGALKGTVA